MEQTVTLQGDIVIGGVTVTTYGSVKGRERIEGNVLQGPM